MLELKNNFQKQINTSSMGYAKYKEDIEKFKDELEHMKSGNSVKNIKGNLDLYKEKKIKEMFDKLGIWYSVLESFFEEDNEGLKDYIIKLKENEIILKGEIHLFNNAKKEYENKISLISKEKIILEKSLKEMKDKHEQQIFVYRGNVHRLEENVKNISEFHQNKIDQLKRELRDCQKNLKKHSNNHEQLKRPTSDVKFMEGAYKKNINKLLNIKDKMEIIYKTLPTDNSNLTLLAQREIKIKLKECLNSLKQL